MDSLLSFWKFILFHHTTTTTQLKVLCEILLHVGQMRVSRLKIEWIFRTSSKTQILALLLLLSPTFRLIIPSRWRKNYSAEEKLWMAKFSRVLIAFEREREPGRKQTGNWKTWNFLVCWTTHKVVISCCWGFLHDVWVSRCFVWRYLVQRKWEFEVFWREINNNSNYAEKIKLKICSVCSLSYLSATESELIQMKSCCKPTSQTIRLKCSRYLSNGANFNKIKPCVRP